MASIPQRQHSRPRSSQGEAASNLEQQQHQPSPPVFAQPITSEDSQTPERNDAESESHQQQEHDKAETLLPDTDSDLKKCWICFSDESEDTPETSPWRSPCPCALVAHEECLLDWIADTEAPRNSRNRSIGPPKIECPQCKSEIKLARPQNYVVEAVRGIERLGGRAVTPGALTVLGATVYNSSLAWGIHSIYAVFGQEDGFRILRPIILNATRPPVEVYAGHPKEAIQKLLGVFVDHMVHWRLYIGLPLITPVLILSRTSFADSVLPMLPILFFATQTPSTGDSFDFGQWPPSASLAFAVLPYLRSAYNFYYRKVWADRERQWSQQIQPRSGEVEDEADQAAAQAQPQRRDDDDHLFEVRIEGDMWEDWDEGEQQPGDVQRVDQIWPQQGIDAQAQPPPDIANHRHDDVAQANQPNNQQQQQQPPPDRQRRLAFSPLSIAETILGAILFPTIAGLSGEVLRLLLPKPWTAATARGMLGIRQPAKGLLQEKWGRTLVGGCLFVVCKDALMLYVKWKMAQMHKRRRVLDFDRAKTATRARS
nr:e3 ubiquitin-protein ligase march5 [Quercus suber]POF04898.1 e3 ubiquitin-protein ligase march5 [Quercus suber]